VAKKYVVKYCENCGKEIPKKVGVSVARYSKKRFCSRECSRTLPKMAVVTRAEKATRKIKEKTSYEVKFCENCGKELKKSRYLSLGRYEAKRFCSIKCAVVVLRKERKGWYRDKIDGGAPQEIIEFVEVMERILKKNDDQILSSRIRRILPIWKKRLTNQ